MSTRSTQNMCANQPFSRLLLFFGMKWKGIPQSVRRFVCQMHSGSRSGTNTFSFSQPYLASNEFVKQIKMKTKILANEREGIWEWEKDEKKNDLKTKCMELYGEMPKQFSLEFHCLKSITTIFLALQIRYIFNALVVPSLSSASSSQRCAGTGTAFNGTVILLLLFIVAFGFSQLERRQRHFCFALISVCRCRWMVATICLTQDNRRLKLCALCTGDWLVEHMWRRRPYRWDTMATWQFSFRWLMWNSTHVHCDGACIIKRIILQVMLWHRDPPIRND